MSFEELKEFLDECISKAIPMPRNMMVVVVDDFYDVVPKEHHQTKNLEFSHRVGNEFIKIGIIPKL